MALCCVTKLHLIVQSTRCTCIRNMLFNQLLDMLHLSGIWIILAKKKCSLTGMVTNLWSAFRAYWTFLGAFISAHERSDQDFTCYVYLFVSGHGNSIISIIWKSCVNGSVLVCVSVTGLDLWGVLVATGVVCIIYCTLVSGSSDLTHQSAINSFTLWQYIF